MGFPFGSGRLASGAPDAFARRRPGATPATLPTAATRENPTAARSGGSLGRKENANRLLQAGERVVLADLQGPGTVTHIWMTVGGPMPEPGEQFLRRQLLEIYYGGSDHPSVSVPMPDFFGAVHGVAVPYASALTAVNEGRGFASRIPMPFRDRV